MNNLIEKSRMFYHFSEISKIPRQTGNEAGIAEHLVNFAKEHGFESFKDEYNNVVIIKPASPGYENKDALILQGHSDMVCVKEEGLDFNFDTDPIKLRIDGDYLRATGTTLGADNGIAVAMILAILEDKNAVHPKIEALITSGEEVGLIGANHIDKKYFTATRLINLDSEEEGVFTASCSGGLRQTLELDIEKINNPYKNTYQIVVDSLLGGHSGMEIGKQRGNAIKLVNRVLAEIKGDYGIVDFVAGEADNAIPGIARCRVATDFNLEELKSLEAVFKSEYAKTDSAVRLNISKVENADKVLSVKSSTKLNDLIFALPHGVHRYSNDIEGLVETSSNLAIIQIGDSTAEISLSHRSSVESRKKAVVSKTSAIARLAGARSTEKNEYPGWEFAANSPLREKMIDVFKEMYGKEAKVEAIHAGLECGVFKRQIGDLDMVSMGCDMQDVHSPEEKVSISSALRTYDFLLEVLKAL